MNKFATIVIGVLLLSACSSAPEHRRPQSFASNEDFWQAPNTQVDLVWANKELRSIDAVRAKLLSYDNVMVEPVKLLLDEQTRYDNLNQQEVESLADYFVARLEQRLANRFTLVDEVQPNTLRLHVTLTNIELPNQLLAVTSSVVPFSVGMSMLSEAVTGEKTNVGAASVELMLMDATTNEPLIAVIDRHSGDKRFSELFDSSSDARDAIDFWVERLGSTLKAQ